MNGGYVMIDGVGIDLSASEIKTIPGIHDKLYDAMTINKPIVIYNVLNGGDTALLTPIGCSCELSGSTINVSTYVGVKFSVSNEDVVTITE